MTITTTITITNSVMKTLRQFETEEEMNDFLLDRFNKTEPSINYIFGASKEENAKQRGDFGIIEDPIWKYIVIWEVDNPAENVEALEDLLTSLPLTNVRDGLPCFEGSSSEIATHLKIKSSVALRHLRQLRDLGSDKVFYSRTADIHPTVKAGGIFYWRIILGDEYGKPLESKSEAKPKPDKKKKKKSKKKFSLKSK